MRCQGGGLVCGGMLHWCWAAAFVSPLTPHQNSPVMDCVPRELHRVKHLPFCVCTVENLWGRHSEGEPN